MADFTITPIPFSGGSLIWTQNTIYLMRLNSTRFIYAFSQQNPDYKFYGIADVSNINDPVPTVNIVKQRAFTGKFTNIKLTPLDITRFVAYDGNDLYVYNTATNDVVEELKITGYGVPFGGNTRDRLWSIKTSDLNIFEAAVVPSNAPNNFDIVLRRLIYNTSTNQFTITTDKIFAAQIGTDPSIRYVHLKRIQGTSDKILVIYKTTSNESDFIHSIQKVGIYSLSTDTISDITPSSSTVSDFSYGDLIPFKQDAIVWFDYNSNNAIEYNGTTFGSPFSYSTGGGSLYIADANWFSESFGVLVRKSTLSQNIWFFRIVNRTGPNAVTTSFPTNINEGLSVSFPTNFVPFYRDSVLDIFDPETLLFKGYNSDNTQKQFIVLRFKP